MARVLVIDDEPFVCGALKKVLERNGHEVDTASGSEQALFKMLLRAPDLVITDVIMPDTNGVDAIKAIRAHFPRIRIIAISGGGSVGLENYRPDSLQTAAYLAAAQQAGADMVLPKPFESRELLAMVQTGLAP